jgi:drug/metabolite transporter (DMT)-like permease
VTNLKNKFLPISLLIIQPIFMASNLIVARGGINIPPISLAFWRWLLAFFVLFLFTHKEILQKKAKISSELFPLMFLGITSASICGAFPFIAGTSTTIINMGIIYSSSPIFIVLFSYLLFFTKLTKIQVLGFCLSIFGVLFVICKGNLNFLLSLKFNPGDLWILGASISWAVYSVYQVKLKTSFTIFSRVTLIALFGALFLFPFLWIEEFFFFKTQFSLEFLFWVGFAALSPSIIAFYLYAQLQKVSDTNIAGLVVYLYPVYGALYGFFLFDEDLKIYHLVGSFFIFLGIFLSSKYQKK